jgi:Amt family ammonium transporter
MGKAFVARFVFLSLLFLAFAPLLTGQTAATSAADAQAVRMAKLEQQVADAKSSGDNAWMLTSAALVLMMTGPGHALSLPEPEGAPRAPS